jgi:hypothetical protein
MTTPNAKRPRDLNALAKFLVDEATSDKPRQTEALPPEKNPAAVELGRLGGLKGGKARAASLSPEKRQEIARKAATARWSKPGG